MAESKGWLNRSTLIWIVSIKEGLCSKTPLILMPMGAEQGHNTHMFLALGYIRVINKFTITEDIVYNEINHVSSQGVHCIIIILDIGKSRISGEVQ